MTNTSTFGLRRLAGALALAQTLVCAWPAVASETNTSGAPTAAPVDREYEQGRESAVPLNGNKGFDAVAVRPTTFFASLVSAGVFVVSLPFTALDPAIGASKARENLVDYPFNDTFKRPLGDLDAMGNPPGDPYPK